jgi:hypothetical protein
VGLIDTLDPPGLLLTSYHAPLGRNSPITHSRTSEVTPFGRKARNWREQSACRISTLHPPV